jgi:hypothetical protein
MSLVSYIARQIAAPIIHTSLLGGEYVLIGEYFSCAQCVFETGTVLGWAFRDRMPVFVQLFCESGKELDLVSYLRKNAASRLAQWKEQPTNFYDLYSKPEITKRFSKLEHFLNSAKVKVRLKDVDVHSELALIVSEGIGFGAEFPELTERLLAYKFDETAWGEAHSAGLDISPIPPNHSPQERQVQILSLIRSYVSDARPDLLNVLGL